MCVQIWESLLSLQFTDDEIYSVWENIVVNIVKTRVSRVVPVELKVDIFTNAEDIPSTPDVLRNVFLTEASEALDILVFKSKVRSYTLTLNLVL